VLTWSQRIRQVLVSQRARKGKTRQRVRTVFGAKKNVEVQVDKDDFLKSLKSVLEIPFPQTAHSFSRVLP